MLQKKTKDEAEKKPSVPASLKEDVSLIEETVIKADENKLEEEEPPRATGKKANLIFVAIAFLVLVGYLFFAGEGENMAHALERISWGFMALGVVFMVLYWILESACMQIIIKKVYGPFSFFKTNLVTLIGQYFNCITPLSSGGQPMQAYYYHRFGLPLSATMSTLLCRFIVYQFTLTAYAALVLILRFGYFMEWLEPLMYLVAIGFVGGIWLIVMLLFLALARKTTTRFIMWAIDLGARVHVIKDPTPLKVKTTRQLDDAYAGMKLLLKEPKMLAQVCGVTLVQLTMYFSISYVIYLGFGLNEADYFTVISCQAFIYMISSFVPLPGAMGAAEGSYVAFFGLIYPDGALVALSTFIWRFFTFYLPIVVGMLTTIAINHSEGGGKKAKPTKPKQKTQRMKWPQEP